MNESASTMSKWSTGIDLQVCRLSSVSAFIVICSYSITVTSTDYNAYIGQYFNNLTRARRL